MQPEKSDFPASSWDKLEIVAVEWRGLDRYGDIFENVRWDDGPSGIFFHKICKTEFTSKGKLQQTNIGKKKK